MTLIEAIEAARDGQIIARDYQVNEYVFSMWGVVRITKHGKFFYRGKDDSNPIRLDNLKADNWRLAGDGGEDQGGEDERHNAAE